MTLEQFLTVFFTKGPWLFFKASMMMLLILHIAFSFVLTRQTKLMIRVVEAKISPTIYHITVIHLLVSIFVFIWSIILL